MEDLPANSGPFGYLSLGLALVTVGLFQASFFEPGNLAPIAATAAGLSLILAAAFASRASNTVDMTAFGLLGMFWLATATIWAADVLGVGAAPDHAYFGWYLALSSIVCIALFMAHRRGAFVVQVVFALMAVWLILYSVAEFTGGPIVAQMAGFEGLISGLASIYLGAALLVNDATHRRVLPIGEPHISKIIIPDDISQLFD